jgi:hypothetical protein
LFVTFVSGRKRVPRPPAKMTPFIVRASALRASTGASLRFRHVLRSAESCAARPHAD